MTHVAILAGEGEYGSDRSMHAVERDLLEGGYRVTYCVPDVLVDHPEFPMSRFSNLDAVDDADVLVIYTRFRRLPDDQMATLERYLERGGAVVGLRTSTHAFHFDAGSPWQRWNDGFGRCVLGTSWVSHHGHGSHTVVRRPEGLEHPILDGVADRFVVRSWLYVSDLAKPCVPLLHGEPVDAECEPRPGPVAWTTDFRGRPVFYTSLGHPNDFEVPSFRRLLCNGIAWCATGQAGPDSVGSRHPRPGRATAP
jgi:type 1 glutamine amidotransferase